MIFPRDSNPSVYTEKKQKCDTCYRMVNTRYGYIEMIDDTLVDIYICHECMIRYENELIKINKARKETDESKQDETVRKFGKKIA